MVRGGQFYECPWVAFLLDVAMRKEKNDVGGMIDAYKKKVEDELWKVCNEVLSVIAIHCLPLANTSENVVFFYKMYVQVP